MNDTSHLLHRRSPGRLFSLLLLLALENPSVAQTAHGVPDAGTPAISVRVNLQWLTLTPLKNEQGDDFGRRAVREINLALLRSLPDVVTAPGASKADVLYPGKASDNTNPWVDCDDSTLAAALKNPEHQSLLLRLYEAAGVMNLIGIKPLDFKGSRPTAACVEAVNILSGPLPAGWVSSPECDQGVDGIRAHQDATRRLRFQRARYFLEAMWGTSVHVPAEAVAAFHSYGIAVGSQIPFENWALEGGRFAQVNFCALLSETSR